MPKEFHFEVVQDSIVVASGSGPDLDAVKREANHYAMMYAQDGPVRIRIADGAFLQSEPK